MSTVAPGKLLTAEEFAKLPDPVDGSKQELVRGEVISMAPPSFRHGIVQVNIAMLLRVFAKEHKLGRVTVESGVVTERNEDTVRGPDVAYWSFEKLPADQVPEVYADVAPDLCVEVNSPGNTKQRTTRKIREYFACGCAWSGWSIRKSER